MGGARIPGLRGAPLIRVAKTGLEQDGGGLSASICAPCSPRRGAASKRAGRRPGLAAAGHRAAGSSVTHSASQSRWRLEVQATPVPTPMACSNASVSKGGIRCDLIRIEPGELNRPG